MPERPRRKLSRRRSFNEGWQERDDRGWTLLHIGARKGDLKEVGFFSVVHVVFIFLISYVVIYIGFALMGLCKD